MRTLDKVVIANIVLALVCLAGIAAMTTSYIAGMSSVRNLRPVLAEVRVNEQANEFIAVLRWQNQATIPLRLDDLDLSFYVNGQYVGSNYERFVAQTVRPSEEPILEFTIPLQDFYRQRLDQARASGQVSWLARGVAKVVLPYRDRTLLLSIRERWSSNP